MSWCFCLDQLFHDFIHGEITFDDKDNLVVQDHTYNKVWVINFERDPSWLRPVP